MHDLELFGAGLLLSLSLCLDIGVVNVALINTALRDGVRAATLFALGSCIGDLLYAIASLLGIGLLLRYEMVRLVVYATGIAVLVAMSAMAARAALRVEEEATDESEGKSRAHGRMFLYGLGITLASPSAIVWFAAVGGSLIAQSDAHTAASLVALLAGFFSGSALWCVFIIGIAAYGGRAFGWRFRQVCHALSAALFLYFAARIAIALAALLNP
jgi:L-lysine exporter family protein LysE/ArgO